MDTIKIVAECENMEKITKDFMEAIDKFNQQTMEDLQSIRLAIDKNGVYGGETNETAKNSIRENIKNIDVQLKNLSELYDKLKETAPMYGKLIAKINEVSEIR